MVVQDNLKIKEIQAEFNKKFPYLKIEFYAKPHEVGKPSPAQLQVDPEKTIAELRTVHTEGDLSIHANQKISTLEQAFADQYGLYVQVFRKSANLWLQTSKTDHWTLGEANGKGERSVKLTDDLIYNEND